MKIIIEREKCIGCGSCAALCPKHFDVADDGKLFVKGAKKNHETGNDELEINKIDCVKTAADSCPVQCIHVIE